MVNYSLPEKYKPNKKILELEAEKKKAGDIGVITPGGKGNIPVLYAKGKSLAEAWENSLINLWINGTLIRTQYDKKNDQGEFVDPPSRDCTMMMVIDEPLSDPMLHRSFPGGPADLEEYRQEVVEGIKDHWVRDLNDPKDTRWEYTYHERMANYRVPGLEKAINQIETMAQAIAKSPITRRSQMISWQPWNDLNIGDPACWQSLWGRMLRDSGAGLYSDDEGQAYLSLNMRFRSRDAYKAAFMNDFAFIDLSKKLAERISEIRNEKVKLGRFIDQSDSYHIYGSYFDEFVDGFVKGLMTRKFEDRVWNYDYMKDIFEEAKPMIKKKLEKQEENWKKQGLKVNKTK